MRALAAVGVLALAITALALVGLLIYQRRASLLDRMRFEQEQRVILEDTVKARTADLDATNASLLMEVAERKSTEERLRKSQNELIQAGKLAALGKMSAALSHEINQPLGAVKSYAYNASRFLERGQTTEVAENISLISEMADRMVRISNHLRGFARQPGEKLRAIPIGDVVQKAIDLSTPQMRSSGVTVTFDPPQPEVFGIGGALRLQQVIVNLLTNAADAMADAPVKTVEIDVQDTGEAIRINLRDHGPGLEPEAMEQVFDAFYTTKEAGVGMGLGLSISFNIVEDFGGSMSVVNHPDGGAVFTVTLNRAVPMQEAAE
jgi:two-component system C4-dicarboxylate transport sensor histidine kinase DctB